MRLLCAWCDPPKLLAVIAPIADDRVSHGICPTHRDIMLQEALTLKIKQVNGTKGE
jgi:hypothetical protein